MGSEYALDIAIVPWDTSNLWTQRWHRQEKLDDIKVVEATLSRLQTPPQAIVPHNHT